MHWKNIIFDSFDFFDFFLLKVYVKHVFFYKLFWCCFFSIYIYRWFICTSVYLISPLFFFVPRFRNTLFETCLSLKLKLFSFHYIYFKISSAISCVYSNVYRHQGKKWTYFTHIFLKRLSLSDSFNEFFYLTYWKDIIFRSILSHYSPVHLSRSGSPIYRANKGTHVTSNNSINNNARGVVVIVTGYGHGDTSSIPGQDWLHFT